MNICHALQCLAALLVVQTVRNPPAMQETLVWSLGLEDPLEKEMATHSSVLAWSIPWSLMCYHLWDCKESDISARVWATNAFTFFIVSSTEEVWDVLLKQKLRTSLAIQWLRLHNPSAGTKVWSLVEELRSCMLWDGLKKKKKRYINTVHIL